MYTEIQLLTLWIQIIWLANLVVYICGLTNQRTNEILDAVHILSYTPLFIIFRGFTMTENTTKCSDFFSTASFNSISHLENLNSASNVGLPMWYCGIDQQFLNELQQLFSNTLMTQLSHYFWMIFGRQITVGNFF